MFLLMTARTTNAAKRDVIAGAFHGRSVAEGVGMIDQAQSLT